MTGDRRILTHRQNVVRKTGKGFDNDVIGRDTGWYHNGLVICRRNRKVDKLAVIVIKEKVEIALAAVKLVHEASGATDDGGNGDTLLTLISQST